MKLEPTVLENRFVRLEPLAAPHREDLRAAADAETEIWAPLYPYSWAGEHFDPTWARVTGQAARGEAIAFALVMDGRCQGTTSYLNLDPGNASVEVGGTYYAPDARGGAANPAAKRLLLTHAFASGARRVSFKVDALNARSRAAVLKLGAVQEGVLRQDRQVWTGRIRDTVVFSILQDEWPAIRERLDARLASF